MQPGVVAPVKAPPTLRPRWLRPSWFAVVTVGLVCLPPGRSQLGASFTVTPADIAAGVLVAVAGWSALFHRQRLPKGVVLLLLPAIAVALATLASADLATSLPGFVRYLEVFVLVPLAVAVVVRDAFDLRLVAAAVLFAAMVQAAVGCWQSATESGASYAGLSIRAVGTFGSSDIMGMSTVVSYGFVIALAVALSQQGWIRTAAVVVVAFLSVALLLSLSRGAWLACLMAACIMLILSGWRKLLGVVCLACFVVGAGLAGGWGSATLKERVESLASVSSQPDQSVNDRYGLWEAATGIWRDHPIVGVGPRGFVAFRDTYAPLQVSAGSDIADPVNGFQRQELRSPHNMYLLVLSEQGLIGFLAFVLLWGGLLVYTLRRRSLVDSAPERAATLAAIGLLAWQSTNFLYSDIGGPPTVAMSIMLGLLACWALGTWARGTKAAA